ncbi:Orphan Neuropeptide Receptor 1 [Frankliniella occidentalis]|nr:Orphan Neuropeptide Receptor 1 [Frankliniella occidentalis]
MDYHRCIFALMYVVPAITLGYLYAQTERLLSHKERPVTLVLYDTQRSARSSSAASVHGYRRSLPARSLLYHSSTLDGTGLDLVKEQRTQKYLVGMTMAFFVLFTPLNLLRTNIWKMGETYDNEYYIDIGYAVFVWLGYLPTCSMPLLVASWMLSRERQTKLNPSTSPLHRLLCRPTRPCFPSLYSVP